MLWIYLTIYIYKNLYNSYVTCMRFKLQHHKLCGSLKQLPIPKWLLISMYFIKKLFSLFNYNIILIIIDWLSKQTIFVLTVDTIILYELAKLFVIYIFFKYNILSHITFDCGSEFVSNFFWSLETALNMRLDFTSGYYTKKDR